MCSASFRFLAPGRNIIRSAEFGPQGRLFSKGTKLMRNRRDYRRDFDESEHPRDARGRFIDDDEDNGGRYQGGYGRGEYGGRASSRESFSEYGSGRYGGGGREGGYGEFRGGGLTRGGYERDYGGSEGGWGYPEEGQRGSSWRGRGMRTENWGDNGDAEGGSWESRHERNDDDYDPDYRHWRGEQLKKLDADYDEWRQERRKKFSEDFDKWRSTRPAKSQTEQTKK